MKENTNKKVALALDIDDITEVSKELNAIKRQHPIDLTTSIDTPDNIYVILFWEIIPWDECSEPLLHKLEHIRHTLVTVSEDGEVWKEALTCDKRGCDEEFYDLLEPHTDIHLWTSGAPLEAMQTLGTKQTDSRLKEGVRIRLICMDDKYAPLPGTPGTVRHIDDAGTVHVDWDSGSTLGLIPDVDTYIVLPEGKEV